jgi:putative membrane protein
MVTGSPTTSTEGTRGPQRDVRMQGALVRTALSSEQTLMSWVRTALSMVTFGFSVAQFFFFLAKHRGDDTLTVYPSRLAISLISLGILVLALATFEHRLRIRRLKTEGLPENAVSSLPMGSAIFFLAIALVALVSVYLRWHL